MKSFLRKTKKWKNIIVFAVCSALIMGECPAGLIKADAPEPKVSLEGNIGTDGKISVTAKLENVTAEPKTYSWRVVNATGSVPATSEFASTQEVTLAELDTAWHTDHKITDSTEEIEVIISYEDENSATQNVSERFDWDNGKLEIDTFQGVTVQGATSETASDGKIDVNGLLQLQIMDSIEKDVTSKADQLPKGKYTVRASSNNVTIIAEYKVEVQDVPDTSSPAPSAESSTGAAVTASAEPSQSPSEEPSSEPPVILPTDAPSMLPPVEEPTAAPTAEPTKEPVVEPTQAPTIEPTKEPAAEPTDVPTAEPTKEPAAEPTKVPAVEPTKVPEVKPSAKPEETKKPQPTAKAAKAGTTLTKGKAVYKSLGSKSVSYDAPKGSEKKVSVPDTVTVNGVKYKVTKIEAGAFKNSKVAEVKLGSNVSTIAKQAFKGCKKLKKVTFSNKTKTISGEAFSGCTNLKSVSLPSSVKTIGEKAFYNCRSMRKIKIGKKLKGLYAAPASAKVSIGAKALQNCVKLQSVIINTQVTRIGNGTFQHCQALAKVLVRSMKLRSVGNRALKGVSDCKISVPSVRLRKYRTLFKNKGQGRKVVIAKV